MNYKLVLILTFTIYIIVLTLAKDSNGMPPAEGIVSVTKDANGQVNAQITAVKAKAMQFDPVDREIAGFTLGEPPSAVLKRYNDANMLICKDAYIFSYDNSNIEEITEMGYADQNIKMPHEGKSISIPSSMMKNDLLGKAEAFFALGKLYKVVFTTESQETATKIFDTLHEKYKGTSVQCSNSDSKCNPSSYKKSQFLLGDKIVMMDRCYEIITLLYISYMKHIKDAAIEITRLQAEQQKAAEQKKYDKLNDL